MFLKTLTMRGFKSFAKATTLQLEPGITCVVGPNGSGKSNVVDALAWVMGEQGAKNLRGGKMDDVIFAGTAGRQGLGRAEVSLTIDNTDGQIPIEYTEVTITRTLFKSGGSEYAVNGAPARLLDIQELLNDSGLGKEMHVIVGQGRLDEILHADPVTRRGFIEEAAGVLKHRRRKDKALRKLTGLQTNLDRVNDLRQELARQLGPLARQAKAASRAATVQAQLRDATARLLADDIVRVQAQLESAHVPARDAEREQLESRAVELATHIDELTTTIDAEEAQIERAESLAKRVSTVALKAHSLAERARDRHGFLASSAPQTPRTEDPAALRSRAALYAQERDQVAQQLHERTHAVRDAERDRDEAKRDLDAATEELNAQRERLRSHLLQRANLESESTIATRALEQAQRELATLQDQAAESSELEAAQAALSTAQQAASELEAAETDLDKNHQRAQEHAQHLTRELTDLREHLANARSEHSQTQARIDALTLAATFDDAGDVSDIDGVGGPLAQSLRIAPGHERQVSAVLGHLASSVTVANRQVASRVLTEIDGDVDLVVTGQTSAGQTSARQTSAGQTSAEVAPTPPAQSPRVPRDLSGCPAVRQFVDSALPAITELLDTVLEATYEATDRDAAHRHAQTHPQAVFVTPDGEVFSRNRIRRTGGEHSARLQARAALEDARDQLEATSALVARLEQREASAQTRLDDANVQVTTALEALYASDAQIVAAGEEVSAAAGTLAALKSQVDQRDQRMRELSEHIAQATERAATAQRELHANTQTVEAEPDTARVDELTARHRELSERVVEVTLSVRSARDRVAFLTDRAAALDRQADQEERAREQAENAWRQRVEMAQRAGELEAVAAQLAARFAREETRLATHVHTLKSQRGDHRTQREAALTRREQVREQIAELTQAQHAANLARERFQLQFDELARRALEETGLGVDNLIEQFGPHLLRTVEDGEPVPYVRAEVEKIARSAAREIAAIGAVNPLALEEYNALKERHDYLESQINDIEATRKDLLKLIADVDTHVRDVFSEAFTDTQREFAHIIERLFPGGDGELVLTDPDDLLNTGVEVYARPAGKRVKRLSLLSGGERSLVAIAILVAIFKARPSPFYVMDEVEAALDDVNLSRLLTVFQELQETSQLIVITHQKRTMEIADALYGVTMGGDGISKVISQRLTGARSGSAGDTAEVTRAGDSHW